MENSKIEWTEATGGPFLGCSEVSPGCGHCYARELALARLSVVFREAYRRAGFPDWETRPIWGDRATRVLTKGFWTEMPRLNRKAARENRRIKVFPSMIDWLDAMPGGVIDQEGRALTQTEVLAHFLHVVSDCRNLDFLLLTKRPENWRRHLEAVHVYLGSRGRPGQDIHDTFGTYAMVGLWLAGTGPAHVWIGTSIEDQRRADKRVPELIRIPAVVRFLSCEPLPGPVDLDEPQCEVCGKVEPVLGQDGATPFCPECEDRELSFGHWLGDLDNGIHWVIVGGESGTDARPMDIEWARALRKQCADDGVAFFMKQLGGTRDKRGALEDLPEDLRVREFPPLG